MQAGFAACCMHQVTDPLIGSIVFVSLLVAVCMMLHFPLPACLPHASGAVMGESRQVIQVPGAPPISVRFGGRPGGSRPPHTPANAQQVIRPDIVCNIFLSHVG